MSPTTVPSLLAAWTLSEVVNLAAIISAGAAILGALLVRRHFQFHRALEFIDRFAGTSMIKARLEVDAWRLKAVPLHEKLAELDWWLTAKGQSAPNAAEASTPGSIMIVMDFFEQLACAYERDLVDRRFVQMVFYFYVHDYWRDLSVVAARWRRIDNDPRLFSRFERLDRVMSGGGALSWRDRVLGLGSMTRDFLLGGRVEWPVVQPVEASQAVFIFGYGTLMSYDSARDTIKDLRAEDMSPAELDGYERGWFVRCPVFQESPAGHGLIERRVFNALNLGIRPRASQRVSGALLRVSPEWLAACDQREKQYVRVDVTKDIVGGAPPDSVVYAYAVDARGEPADAPDALMVEDVQFLEDTIRGLAPAQSRRFAETTLPPPESVARVSGDYKFLDPVQQRAAFGHD